MVILLYRGGDSYILENIVIVAKFPSGRIFCDTAYNR